MRTLILRLPDELMARVITEHDRRVLLRPEDTTRHLNHWIVEILDDVMTVYEDESESEIMEE